MGKNIKVENLKDFYIKLAYNYNDAIENLLKLSKFFKQNNII